VRTAAILPVKSFARAKQRLAASLPEEMRLALARAMLDDVLAALARSEGIEHVFLVTREPGAARAARTAAAEVIADERESGQSAAVQLGVAAAVAAGFERVLCVPGDCPALDPAEVEELLDGHGHSGAEVAILPDRHGSGTNGLLLAPADAIEPSFGPGSRARHESLARAAGVRCRVSALRSMTFDVDTGEDLAALGAALAARDGGAARTRALLAASDVPAAAALAARA
jgi:2-phospho-L-lactate guanylyltransferase